MGELYGMARTDWGLHCLTQMEGLWSIMTERLNWLKAPWRLGPRRPEMRAPL